MLPCHGISRAVFRAFAADTAPAGTLFLRLDTASYVPALGDSLCGQLCLTIIIPVIDRGRFQESWRACCLSGGV